jgi:hypothetical protein
MNSAKVRNHRPARSEASVRQTDDLRRCSAKDDKDLPLAKDRDRPYEPELDSERRVLKVEAETIIV